MLRIFLFFLLLFPALISPSLVGSMNTNLHSGMFFAYNVTTFIYEQNITKIVKQVFLFRVINVYPNNTLLLNFTVYNINFTSYFAPQIILQNASVPVTMFYISPSLLGNSVINRSGELLVFKGEENGYYVYQNISYIGRGQWILTIWFNKDGIGERIESVQTGDVYPHSKTVYVLWLTNFYNQSIPLPYFKGYTLANAVKVNITSNINIVKIIQDTIIIVGIIAMIAILIFRK